MRFSMLNITKNLLLVYLLLKPFYLFGSGGLQVADLFLLAGFFSLCILSVSSYKHRAVLLSVVRKHRLFVLFVMMTMLVNGVYFLAYPEMKFVMSSLYYVFNFIAIITFGVLLSDKVFLGRLGGIFKFNLLVQVAIWAIHLGRYDSPDRYMGTFNDPNQFGYYVLLSLLFIYAIDMILNKKKTYIFYAISIFLIYVSGSTGMLLGLSIFSICFLVSFIVKQSRAPYAFIRKLVYTLAVFLLCLIPIFLIVKLETNQSNINVTSFVEDSFLFTRTDEKIQKADGTANISIWEDRGLDTISKYPDYILYGSGEGNFERFVGVTNNFGNEIHSTFPSILFYYGIIPFLVIMVWLIRQIRRVDMAGWVILLPVFATSFTLINQRQALFWVLIVLTGFYMSKKNEKTYSYKNMDNKAFSSPANAQEVK